MAEELRAPGVNVMSTSKISGYGPTATVVTGGTRSGSVDRAGADSPAASPASAPSGDSVTLTSSARTLQKLSEAIASAPVVDSGRVDAVKSQIAKNTYKVDSLKVAAKLLAADQEFAAH